MKVRLLLAVLVVLVALVLAACGGGGSGGENATPTSIESSGATEDESACHPGPQVRCFDARLDGADLAGANLVEAGLAGATLERADLHGADLTSANLNGTNLEGANLRGAYLVSTSLRDADLRGADLTEAKLTKADLTEADLTAATLTGVAFTDPPILLNVKGVDDARLAALFDVPLAEVPHTLTSKAVVVESQEGYVSQLRAACAGTPDPRAGTALAGTFRPMAEVYSTEEPHEAGYLPATLEPAAERFTALILCVDPATYTDLATCTYTVRGTVTAVAEHRLFRVVDAKTGAVVASRMFDGDPVFEGCPMTLAGADVPTNVVSHDEVVAFAAPFTEAG